MPKPLTSGEIQWRPASLQAETEEQYAGMLPPFWHGQPTQRSQNEDSRDITLWATRLYAGAAMDITTNEKAFAHVGIARYEDDSVRQLSAGQQR